MYNISFSIEHNMGKSDLTKKKCKKSMTYAVCQYFPLMFLKNTVQTLRRGLMFIILRLIYKTIGAYYIFFRWKYTSKLDAHYICVKKIRSVVRNENNIWQCQWSTKVPNETIGQCYEINLKKNVNNNKIILTMFIIT